MAIVSQSDVDSLVESEIDELLARIERDRAALDAAQMSLLAALDRRQRVADLRLEPYASPTAARERQRLATGLGRLPGALERLASGEISLAHLKPLVDLRDRLSDAQVEQLLDEATEVDPSRISRRAHRRATPVENVKPEGSMRASIRGGTAFSFDYSVLDAEIVRNALDAVLDQQWRAAHPDREPVKADRDPWGQRLAAALLELCRRQLAGELGRGTPRPSLHVVISYEKLWGLATDAGICETLDGVAVPVGDVRRLLAEADIIPYVLGGDSEILDFGRSRRLFSKKQKLAIQTLDATCMLGDCDVGARYTQAHHAIEWRNGGPTDLANAAGVCPHCHRLCDHGWRIVVYSDRIETYDPGGALRHTRRRGRRIRAA